MCTLNIYNKQYCVDLELTVSIFFCILKYSKKLLLLNAIYSTHWLSPHKSIYLINIPLVQNYKTSYTSGIVSLVLTAYQN